LNIIEKLGDNINLSPSDVKISMPSLMENPNRFTTLKFACLLLGVGIGMLLGYFICLYSIPGFVRGERFDNYYQAMNAIFGACVLTFGGIGLLVAFLVEMNYAKKNSGKEQNL
jgi:hypothetical protein